MISVDYLQKAIILQLRNNAPLVAALGTADKITESQYQGQEVGFPTVKVDLGPQTPIGNGTDHKKLSNMNWSVQIFSENLGSVQANNIMGLVNNALFDKQIVGWDDSNNPIFYMLRLDVVTQQSALRLTNRLWKAEIFLECVIYLLADNPNIPS